MHVEVEYVGSRDRPSKETKKKPKDKSAKPTLAPLSDMPQLALVIDDAHATSRPARTGSRGHV